MPRILIREPNHFYTFELPVTPGGQVVVGTAPTCQLALPGVGGLSPTHARIVCQPQGYVIEDLQSQYGVTLNGRRVQAEYMAPGAEYMLGAACITLEAAVPPAAQQAQPAAVAPSPQVAESPGEQAGASNAAPRAKITTAKDVKGTAGPRKSANLDELAKKYARSGGKSSVLTLVYVVILLLAALYAGIALRHWERTGNFLPGIQADGK